MVVKIPTSKPEKVGMAWNTFRNPVWWSKIRVSGDQCRVLHEFASVIMQDIKNICCLHSSINFIA